MLSIHLSRPNGVIFTFLILILFSLTQSFALDQKYLYILNDKCIEELYFDAKMNFDLVGEFAYTFRTYTNEESGETLYHLVRVNINSTEKEVELVNETLSEDIVAGTPAEEEEE